MKKPSHKAASKPQSRHDLREKIIGLGENSFQKSYYPQLQKQFEELQGKYAELESARQRISESEAKYQQLFEKMLDGFAIHEIVVDEKGRPVDYIFLEVNHAFETITGLNRNQVIGRRVTEVIPSIKNDTVDWIEIYGNVALKGEDVCFEAFVESLNRWFSVSAYSPQKGYFASVIEDITQKKEAQTQLQASLNEKTLLLKEVHHRVKNNMQIICSLLNLQSNQIDDHFLKKIFRVSQDRIHSMALVHEELYRAENFSEINISQYIQQLTQKLISVYKTHPDKIRFEMDIQDVGLGIDDAVPCGLILNELITNALVHGFPDETRDEPGLLKIAIHQSGDGAVELIVADNGVGLPDNLDIHTTRSLGLYLVRILAEDQMRGVIEVNRSPGTEFKIILNRKQQGLKRP